MSVELPLPGEVQMLPAGFTVAVIGAGPHGAELAWLSVRAGLRTIVEDVFPSKLRNLTEILRHDLDGEALQRHLVFATSVEEAVREADLALDFVPDELESKLEIFSLFDRMAPPRTIFCSPMTAVSISDLQSCTYRAERCIAVQKETQQGWRNAPTVTLVRGSATSQETAAVATAVWQRFGKQVKVVKETVPAIA